MTLIEKINEHISHCESENEFGTVRQICLCAADMNELHGKTVKVKVAEYYHGIAVHEVKGDRSYIVIEL